MIFQIKMVKFYQLQDSQKAIYNLFTDTNVTGTNNV